MKRIFSNIKENKGYFIIRLLLSLMIGLSFFLDSILVFKNDKLFVFWSYCGYKYVYFNEPNINSVIVFILTTIISFVIITFIGYLYQKISDKIIKNDSTDSNKYNNHDNNKEKNNKMKNNKRVFAIIFICIFMMYLPYFFSFFPGGFDCNTVTVIKEALGEVEINNHYPILYTLIMKLFLDIGKLLSGNIQAGFNMMGISQFLFMVFSVSYFIYWFYKKDINKWGVVLLTLFFGLFKLFPLYSITIWKETPWSLFVIFYSLQIADIVLSKGEILKEKKFTILYIINMLFICFLRNNGIYIVIGTTICLFFVLNKYKKIYIPFSIYKRFVALISIIIIVTYLIQGPLFNYLKINGEYVEKIGIPMQQIGYVLVNDEGVITEEQKEYLSTIFSIDLVKKNYSPWNVDCIKTDSDYREENLIKDKAKFYKTYIELFIQNPKLFIKSFFLITTGYWDINRMYDGNLKDYASPISQGDDGSLKIYQFDLIQGITGTSISDYLFNYDYEPQISSAIFIFMVLISATYIFKTKRYTLLLVYCPTLLTVATIFIATPLAFALRYVYPTVLFTPMAFLIPFLKPKDNMEEIEITKEKE